MRSPEEGPSSAGADPGYEERTSGRCTGASQRPVRNQPEDELTQERSQVTSPTLPTKVVVPEHANTMKLDILRKYYQITECETNRTGTGSDKWLIN